MDNFQPKTCDRCGSTRFKKYSELDFEERIVAESRATDRIDPIKIAEKVICARCFSGYERKDSKA